MKTYSPSSVRSIRGFSLMELLPAMVIFSFVLIALAYALEASLGMMNHRTSGASTEVDFRTTIETFRRDLQSVVVDRPLHYSFKDQIPEELKVFVDNRKFIPIEINRSEGEGLMNSFVNGEDRFSSLLFATVVSSSRYAHPVRENNRMSTTQTGVVTNITQSADAFGEVCIVGYYVAYTPDSDQRGATRSMKLYRHFRSGGINFGDGHSNGILAYASDVYDPSSIRSVFRKRSFLNRDLPFLMTFRYTQPNNWEPASLTQPWPMHGLPSGLEASPSSMSPPKFIRESWLEPAHPIHDFVFGDEEVARYVVEFVCTPYKKMETSPGRVELLTAEMLNRQMGLANTEWPVLVKPDFIDITLGIVGVDAALQMTRPEDWTLPPSGGNPASLTPLDRIKTQQLRRYSFRVPVN